eukprot:9895581-Lingulodinium_polyedra.AAC.1
MERGRIGTTRAGSAWAELWVQVVDYLDEVSLGAGGVQLFKVKAHASGQDVVAGRSTVQAKRGNDAVDAWAKHAAAQVRAPLRLRQEWE